jgi:hypothetical protein
MGASSLRRGAYRIHGLERRGIHHRDTEKAKDAEMGRRAD